MSMALPREPSAASRIRVRRKTGRIAALDLGTSKICCFIAAPRPDGSLALVGRSLQSADGLKGGEIVDMAAAEGAVRAVLQEAEEQAGETVQTVVVSMGAGRPRSILLRVERPLEGRSVVEEDVLASLQRARAEIADAGLAVLHMIMLEASVDDGRPVEDPRGVVGRRLGLLVHVIAAEPKPIETVLRCLERCHLDVRGLVASPYASGLGCLTEDERERGCLLVDIGADATQIAHFAGRKLAHLDRIDMGGERITHDVAWGLSTTRREAERVKSLYGAVVWRDCDDHVRIKVRQQDDRADVATGDIPRTRLTMIVRARVEEIFGKLGERLREHGDVIRSRPPRSIVLTGGAAQLEGMDELAQEVFGLPARIGRPRGVLGEFAADEDPGCSATAGALAMLAGDGTDTGLGAGDTGRGVGNRLGRLRAWLRQNF